MTKPSGFDSLSEFPEAIRRLTIFPEPLLHILVHLWMSAVDPPAMVIDFERVPGGIVLMENELLEQIGGAVLPSSRVSRWVMYGDSVIPSFCLKSKTSVWTLCKKMISIQTGGCS